MPSGNVREHIAALVSSPLLGWARSPLVGRFFGVGVHERGYDSSAVAEHSGRFAVAVETGSGAMFTS
jgi:hypothetical protein